MLLSAMSIMMTVPDGLVKLGEVLVFQAIRNWFEQNSEKKAIVKALSDQRMTRMVSELHKNPDKKWGERELQRMRHKERKRKREKER